MRDYLVECIKKFSLAIDGESRKVSDKIIDGVIDKINKRKIITSEYYMQRYVAFQYWFWIDFQETPEPESRILFSKKGVDRFISMGHTKDVDSFLRDFDVSLMSLFDINPSIDEDYYRKEFHNKTMGLSFCLEHTTLYDRKSRYCITCNERSTCKKLLIENYPKIALKKGISLT